MLDWINNEDIFIEMIESRNTLSHTYNEGQAKVIYEKCGAYLNAMKTVAQKLNT